jgi:hypothetical protein
MNFYVDSGGVVLHVDPERIFQGSANANTIRFVGAFASNLSVTTAFKLPNGVWTVPQKMTLSAQLPGVQMPDGTQFNTWEYKIPATVTENYGAVNVQFFVYGDTGGTGGQIASAMSSFEVEKGVPITLPDPTDDYNTLLTQILSTLSQLQGFYDGLNTEVEELQTSVRGLQGEVSGIQIDLEQVHTDLGNRVEKTTLTYSLYGTDKNGNQAIIPYGTTGLGNSIPQYTADSEIRIPASPTQSYYAANKGYVDKGLQEKLDKTGGEIHGDLLVGGELRVLDDTIIIGNLTVQGTTITEDAETIMSKANVIVTNSEGAPLTQLSGIGIRTNATLVYGIMYDPGDDTVKLGEGTLDANNEFTFNSGEGTAVATRADSAMWTNGHLSMWNAAEYRFVDSGIAADNVVTVNTAQQITGAKTFAQAVRVGTGNVYASYYTGGVIWRDSNGNDHANIFPAGSGTLALTSDIPTDYVTEKEFSNLAQQVEDLYALGEQGGLFTVTTVEDTYTARETAGGNLNIADGVSTIVKTIQGSTVKCDNLIPYSYADTTKTVNGVTFTDNGDGSITVNGTATENAIFNLKTITVQIGSNYFLSGCPSTGSTTTYIVYAADGVYGYADAGAGKLINPASTNLSLSVLVYAGATLSNVVFRPMLNAGTTALPYQPYFKGLKNAYFKEIVSTGKNLFDPSTFPDGTVNGVTITIENEGILLNGTATQRITLYGTKSAVTLLNYLRGKTTYFYFENNQNVRIEHSVTYLDGTKSSYPRTDIPRSTLLDKTAITAVPVLVIENGATFNNQLFKAALYQADTATIYEPYKQSVLSLPAPVENPAYNTLDFQTGKNISQGITKVFDGTEGWSIYVPSTGNEEAGYTVFRQNIIPLGISGSIESICNKYPYKAYGYALSTSGPCQSFSSEGQTFFIKQNQYSTIDEWKAYLAAQYAAGDPVMVRYKTAEVQSETDLNASSDRYIAWKGGSETIVQGEVDNSEYGAENTVTQDYFTITGGTANGN